MTRNDGNATDLAIAGGGPAGAIAAILLARAGFRVVVIDGAPRAPWIEGAGQRLVAALKAQRLVVEGLGPLLERRVAWGALTGAPNREHALARPVFDEGLLAQAADEGVRVIRSGIGRVRAGQVALADGPAVTAGLVIEARGRRAPVAAGRQRGIPTVSIAGPSGPLRDAAIAAHPEGWVWRIAAGATGWTQVTLDAARADPPDAAWRRLTGTPMPEGATLRASELRLTAPELDPALPRIGDAAVAMDPLSGHGLFWALASALMAVPLATAILDGQQALAARFYADRVVGTYLRQARVGRDFYRAAGIDAPFWQRRAGWPDDLPAEPEPPAAPRTERRVIVRRGRLAEAEVLVSAQDPGGAAFVGGIEIAPILARLRDSKVSDRAGFAARVLPDAPPEMAGRVYDWLAERGVATGSALQQKEVRS